MGEPQAEYAIASDGGLLDQLAGRQVERVCLLQSGREDKPVVSRLLLFLDNGCCFEFVCRGHLLPLANHQCLDIHTLLHQCEASYCLEEMAIADPDWR